MDLEVARNFLIALLIGALVGIEREKKKGVEPGPSLGGIRTYILIAMVGAASAWLAREMATPWAFFVTLALVGAAVVASYLRQNRNNGDAPGLTSEVAALAVCLFGAMAVVGQPELAVALAVVTSAVLAYKRPLHTLVGRIGAEDLFAGIKLLIASFIVLPLLPDATVDPWGAINPYTLWLLVILISALSLVGYAAVRWLGPAHGAAVTGIAGGLVSSTAATLSMARTSRSVPDPSQGHALLAGILLAWLVMLLRVAVLVAVVNRALLPALALPLAAMGAATAAFAFWHFRAGVSAAGQEHGEPLPVTNPFSLTAAVKFGALFAAMLLVVKLAQEFAPGVGIYVVAALAGTVDVDAITLSLSGAGYDATSAAIAITVATVSNTVVKCGMASVLGSGIVRRHIALATAAIVAAAFGASWLV